jgi:hypothetical protein
MLVCAPTGAGKTNVAMLTMLHEIGLHRWVGGLAALCCAGLCCACCAATLWHLQRFLLLHPSPRPPPACLFLLPSAAC